MSRFMVIIPVMRISVGLALAWWLAFPPYAFTQSFIDRVLAAVENVPITLSEYRIRHRQEVINDSAFEPFRGEVDEQLLGVMIDERLQVLEAERRGLMVSEEEVEAALAFIAQQNNLSPTALLYELNQDGIAESDFRASVRDQQMIRKLRDVVANSRVNVSDQEIENFINSHNELQHGDVSFELSHLFIETRSKSAEAVESDRDKLRQVRQQIQNGLEFGQAIQDHGGVSDGDGYLGWRKTGQLPELFVQALQAMNPESNSLSPILQSDAGLHLLKLHNLRDDGEKIEQQQVQHILITPNEQYTLEEAENLASQVYDELVAGEPFEKMSRLYSMDSRSRDQGGVLGWINPGTLGPEFESATRRLAVGEISRPVRSQYGFHLIRVNDRRKINLTGEVAANTARQEIFRRKAQEIYFNWFQALRQRAFIEYVGMSGSGGT